jgi:aromatic-L-amino-acid decarboxylase
MSPDEFRRAGHAMIDWIADYWAALGEDATAPGEPRLPVLSRARPGDLLAALPQSAPERPEAWDAIAGDVDRLIMPGITHWQSPNFYAYFPAEASFPAVLGEVLSAGLGVNGMLWATSPAATELELRVVDWMAELLGLPEGFWNTSAAGAGCIQGTASESTLIALLAARARALAGDPAADPAALVVYTSTQAHSSVIKAAMIAGLAATPEDRRRVRLIETYGAYAMDPAALEKAIENDRAGGLRPCYVCATVGTTSSTAVDPVPAIGAIARRHGVWLHVDAAHAGAAAICPEFRHLLAGVERADSLCFNPHKWLLTNFDCDLFWTSDRQSLERALSITPEYLRNTAAATGAPAQPDLRDWQVPLGRRFRALKLWFVLRRFGAEALRAHVREHVRVAGAFETWVAADGRFELLAPRTLNLVCFRLAGPDGPETDARNRDLLNRINASGKIYLTHTVLSRRGPDGRASSAFTLRMCVGGSSTQERHVRAAWEQMAEQAGRG